MEQHSLELRCMYGCLASDPDTEILHVQENLHGITFTQICCRKGDIILRKETGQNRVSTDVVARLKICAPVIELETYIPDTTVEAPPSAFLARRYDYVRLSLPQSTTAHRHSIHLRPHDTIDFRLLNVKIEITLPREPLIGLLPAVASVTMPPALIPDAVIATDPGVETESDDDLGKRPQSSIELAPAATSRSELNDAYLVKGLDGLHETQDTQPLGRPKIPAHQVVTDTVIDESQHEEADDVSDQPLRGVDAVEDAADTPVHDGDGSAELPEAPKSADDGSEASEVDIAKVTTSANPVPSTSAARRIRRSSVARTDQYEVPDSSAKKRKCLPKAALDSHDDQDQSVDFSSAKKRKVAVLATPDSEDDEDEIVVARASVKPKKSLRSGPAKQATSTPAKRATSTPAKRATPTPAKRATSTRSTRSLTPSSSAFVGKTPKILLSRSELAPAVKRWMTMNKIKVVDETPSRRTNFVCVVRDESLPATVKVLKTLLADKPVVGDSWIVASQQERELQNVEDYVHPDLKDIDADAASRRSLFAGMTLFFTAAAVESWGGDWSGIQDIATDAGAVEVLSGNASKGHALWPQAKVILFGLDEKSDGDAETLIKSHRRIVYNKSELPQWIIHADVDLSSSPQLTLPLGGKKKGRI